MIKIKVEVPTSNYKRVTKLGLILSPDINPSSRENRGAYLLLIL